jgi:LmbE family N-acetylglucosaminyl deacetylase
VLASRILILAPHPDDEVVGCAIAMERARKAGCEVFVLTLTSGVPARDHLWPWQRPHHAERVGRRLKEAAEAALMFGFERVGAPPSRPSRALRRHLPAVRQEVAEAIGLCRAQVLWVPAYEGGHQDHDAANAVGTALRHTVPVWEFAEYNLAGGRVCSHRFPGSTGTEVILSLDAGEAERKKRALSLYASERGNLAHVACRQESFRPLAAYDYGRPPHPGRLFYERFRWVPFHHPRIDRTPSSEVSRQLVVFLGSP